MSKLLKLGAALVILALFFTGCPEDDKKGPAKTNPVVNTVTLSSTGLSQTAGGDRAVKPGDAVSFSAVVTGTDGTNPATAFNTGYTIVVTPVAPATMTTLFNAENPAYANGSRALTVKADATGSFKVKAVSLGDGATAGNKVDSAEWTIVVDATASSDFLTAFDLVAWDQAHPATEVLTLTAMAQNSEWIVGAKVEGQGTVVKTYTLTITANPTALIVSDVADETKVPGGKKIKIAASETGTITITATATATAVQQGLVTTKTWNITVGAGGPPGPGGTADFTNAQWKIYNLKTTPSTGTTTSVASALDNGRYVIYNNETTTLIDAGSAVTTDGGLNAAEGANVHRLGIKDATFFYMDVPFVANMADFQGYGMEAQMRIVGDADGVTDWPGTNRMVVVGAWTDPQAYVQQLGTDGKIANPQDVPELIGFRRGANGNIRGYVTRVGNTGDGGGRGFGGITLTQAGSMSAAQSATIPGATTTWQASMHNSDFARDAPSGELPGGPAGGYNSTNKFDGFRDQDFTFRIMRIATGTWILYVTDADGNQLLRSYACGSEGPTDKMQDATPHYFGFLIGGLKVEISNVKFFFDDGEVPLAIIDHPDAKYEDDAVAGKTPAPLQAKRVVISHTATTAVEQVPGINLTIKESEFGASQLLSARITPYSAAQTFASWAIGDSTTNVMTVAAEGTSGARVTKAAIGQKTIVATPTIGGVNGEFVINIISDVAVLTGIKIKEPAVKSIIGGTGHPRTSITLEAQPEPGNAVIANPVTWSITAGNESSVATIDSSTGVLTAAATVSAKATITVKVEGTLTELSFNDTIDIVVRPNEDVLFSWDASTITTLPTLDALGSGDVGQVTVASNTAKNPFGVDIAVRNGSSELASLRQVTAFNGEANYNNLKGYSLRDSRLNIGVAASYNSATSATASPEGIFDLSARKFKITVEYITFDASASNSPAFQVHINNNTTGEANSPLGNNNPTGTSSRVINLTAGTVTQWTEVSVEIDPVERWGYLKNPTDALYSEANYATLEKAFINIRCDNSGTALSTANNTQVVGKILVEYID